MAQALDDYEEFLALASHELKTPTATLLATAQLLRRQLEQQGTLEPDQLRRAVDRLQEQSERLSLLVENLLDAGRINSGSLTFQPETADAASLVRTVIARFKPAHPDHAIVLLGPQQLVAVVDPTHFERIIANLVSNALKYSPDGGRIELELSQTDEAKLCVSLRDFGIGIPPDGRNRLFERFYRGHAESELSGLGIGLFITRYLVELHGGTISADSPPGGGTRFTIVLPAVTF